MTEPSTTCESTPAGREWQPKSMDSMEAFHARNQTLDPIASHPRVMNLLRAMIQCRPKPKPLQPEREKKVCVVSRTYVPDK